MTCVSRRACTRAPTPIRPHTRAAQINEFLQAVPRDLLYTLRCNNLVRSVNLDLGGSSRDRFLETARSAVRGWYDLTPPDRLGLQGRAASSRIIADLRLHAGASEDAAHRSTSSHDAGFSLAHHDDDADFQTSPWLWRKAQYAYDMLQLRSALTVAESVMRVAGWMRGAEPVARVHSNSRADWG